MKNIEINDADDLGSQITDKEFNQIRALVFKMFGIDLTEQKRALVVGRLLGYLRKNGFTSFQSYYNHLISEKSLDSLSNLINLISTNHTFFYREKEHFELFSNVVLPEIVKKLKSSGSNDLRIWCAGCSSGEEPYMLMMLLMEYFGNEYHLWNPGLLATDISEKVLQIAKSGVYQPEKLPLLPKIYLHKYFSKLPNGHFAISDKLKNEITFRRFNLMNDVFPFKKSFHIIFCRNVMIYFDQPTRDTLIKKFYNSTVPGGYLFIGHSETLGRGNELYKFIQPAVYKKM